MTRGPRASSAGRESTGGSRRRRGLATLAVAGVVLAGAAGPAGARPGAADSAASLAKPPQEVAPQVTMVQRVARQVTIESLKDERISAKGADLVAISSTGSHDVPDVAMRAYKNAAEQMAADLPGCQIPWTLLAGIGRVESDHGRYGGSVLGVDGLPRPAIRGVALNGVGPVAAIADSDDGRWDGDDVWDRAVGPMQFIPTTWDSAGRDGDGDGEANPNDIDDAALAAADYLCPASGSILSDAALDAAIYSYNHSDYYVALVRAFMTGYETGVFDIPSPPPPPADPEDEEKDKKDKKRKKKAADADATKQASTKPKAEPRPEPKPTRPKSEPKDEPRPSKPSKPQPTPEPTTTPKPTATPSPTTSPTSTGAALTASGDDG